MSGHWNLAFIHRLLQSLPRRSPNTWFSFFFLGAPSNSPQHHGSVYTGGRTDGQVIWRRCADSPAESSVQAGKRIQISMPKAQRAGAKGHISSCKSLQPQKTELICHGATMRSFICKQDEACATDNEAALHPNTRVIFGINNTVLSLNLSAIACGIGAVLH